MGNSLTKLQLSRIYRQQQKGKKKKPKHVIVGGLRVVKSSFKGLVVGWHACSGYLLSARVGKYIEATLVMPLLLSSLPWPFGLYQHRSQFVPLHTNHKTKLWVSDWIVEKGMERDENPGNRVPTSYPFCKYKHISKHKPG